jgi:hypothetical protein
MIKLKHTSLIVISGLIWLGIGIYLLQLGINLLMASCIHSELSANGHYPAVTYLSAYVGNREGAALILVALGLFIGGIKGRYVLGKSARRGVDRILAFPNPTSLGNIYSVKYYLLLVLMMSLGISIKFLGIAGDIRGVIDITIGSALTNGSMYYFRFVQSLKNHPVS